MSISTFCNFLKNLNLILIIEKIDYLEVKKNIKIFWRK